MAQIGKGPNRPIKRPPPKHIKGTGSKQQQIQRNRAAKLNRQDGLKDDIKEAKTSMADEARQNVQTDKDKEVKDKQKEKFTPSVGVAESNKSQTDEQPKKVDEGPSKEEKAQAAEQQINSAEQNLLTAFTDSGSTEMFAKIHGDTEAVIQDKGNKGEVVDSRYVFAEKTKEHILKGFKDRFKNPTDVKRAAKTDPEIAKNLKILQAADKVTKSIDSAAKDGVMSAPNGVQQQNLADGSSAAAAGGAGGDGPPNVTHATASANPFDAGGGPSGPGGAQQAQQGEPPLYHKSPEEQAQIIQERNSQMQEIMKVYNEMMQENRKAAAERFALIQQTNQEISQIFLSIHARRLQKAQAHHDLYMKVITEAWG